MALLPRKVRGSGAFGGTVLGIVGMWDVRRTRFWFFVGVEGNSEFRALPASPFLCDIVIYADGFQGMAGFGGRVGAV